MYLPTTALPKNTHFKTDTIQIFCMDTLSENNETLSKKKGYEYNAISNNTKNP